ncbi:glycosyltransferase [Tannerella sp. AF04-6]|jgi:glycosyltransferase involved in cell wall biosynthesis|uniref:glycosyltransferase n=1 Tax=Coprobacter fastidiosus TaxID=1099853 RepID=UPI000EF034E2|nr:glycosyltransferase [Coprobacter fastidiosus]RHS45307.1 glycosyltransferase [Tannerella sp. AF04-6]
MPYFSVIIPVYNRPDEVRELLESLSKQTLKDFEVLLIEDGSVNRCDTVAQEFDKDLNICYFYKENSGRSLTRNYGMERASGEYLIFFDSDCIIPERYFEIVKARLEEDYVDCFGGPDAAHSSFSNLQKAISYSMTSFFTTGGIRGGKKGMEKFTPRTFNMGFSKEVYKRVGGFKDMFGEDIDLSLRIQKAGFHTVLIRDAFVYHKRRVSFRSFYRQVSVFGRARVDLYLLHPESLKIVHLLPAAFVLGSLILILLSFFCIWALLPLIVYFFALFFESLVCNHSLRIAGLSVLTSIIQLGGYGIGFLSAFIKKVVFRQTGDLNADLERLYKKK